MSLKFTSTARKLQSAINGLAGDKILLNSKQWYHKDRQKAVTQYIVLRTKEENGKKVNEELFRTYSQIQMVLFLRDYWYILNGWEVPTDNLEWEEVKAEYVRKKDQQRDTKGTIEDISERP